MYSPKQDHAVAVLDELGDFLAAERPFVDSGEERMPLADDALAEHRGRDGDAGLLGEFQQGTLEAEAVDFDAGEDDRPLGRGDAARRLADRLAKRLGIAGRSGLRGDVRSLGHDRHQVARQFDVAGLPKSHHGRQHAVDFGQGGVRIVQFGHGAADVAEDVGLGAKVLHAMVQQRVGQPLADAGRAADDHDRRLLGEGAGDRVAEAQPAHAVGDADGPDAVESGVGVGGESGAVFARACRSGPSGLFSSIA